jgi:hypothetical protein
VSTTKRYFGGLKHGELFLVDGLGHHNDAILHEGCTVVELIPNGSPSLGLEFLVFTGVGSFLDTVGVFSTSTSSGTSSLSFLFLLVVFFLPPAELSGPLL